jgi:hypothetical protein
MPAAEKRGKGAVTPTGEMAFGLDKPSDSRLWEVVGAL